MDLLQKYIFIPLDIFKENVENKGIKNKMDGWLTFLGMDEPEKIIELINTYPEFREMYEHVYYICRNVEDVMGIFSEELRIMNRNTVRYMVDEMQETIDEQKEMIVGQQEQLKKKDSEMQKMILEKDEKMKEKEHIIEELKKQIALLQKNISRDGVWFTSRPTMAELQPNLKPISQLKPPRFGSAVNGSIPERGGLLLKFLNNNAF